MKVQKCETNILFISGERCKFNIPRGIFSNANFVSARARFLQNKNLNILLATVDQLTFDKLCGGYFKWNPGKINVSWRIRIFFYYIRES